MTLQDLMMLYGVTLGKRRTAKQKYLFAQQLNESLPPLGWPVRVQQREGRFSKIENLIAGDLANAKVVIAVPFDTPAKALRPQKYYPFHPDKNVQQRGRDLALQCVLELLCFGAACLMFWSGRGTGAMLPRTLAALLLAGVGVWLLLPHASPCNFSRCSGAVATAVKLAEDLSGEENIAFAFCDHAVDNYDGFRLLAQEMPTAATVLLLDNLTSGPAVALAHGEYRKEAAEQLCSLLPEDKVYDRIQVANLEVADDNVTSYFVDALTDQVIQTLIDEKGYTETQAYKALYSGGLTIYSTQDSNLQKICDEEVNNEANYGANPEYSFSYRLTIQKKDGTYKNYSEQTMLSYYQANDKNYNIHFASKEAAEAAIEKYKNEMLEDGDTIPEGGETVSYTLQPQAAMTLIDQSTGEVKALVGGRGEKTASKTLNRATSTARQPGSTYKVLAAYAPALDSAGMTLATVQDDAPYSYENGTSLRNYDNNYRGFTTLREAITNSINVVTVKTLTEIGTQVGFDYLDDFGFTTIVPEDNTQSLCLGGLTKGVYNLELTAAYATIANGGTYTKPRFFTKILDHDGNVLIDNTPQTHTVLKDTTAWLITSAMKDVMTQGTGVAANISNMPVAGKSGTTTKNRDSLFAGFSPYYTCVVWGGYDDNSPLKSTRYTKNVWKAVMQRVNEGLEYRDFEKPEGIETATVCKKSGKLAVAGICDCDPRGNQVYTEYFASGTVPTEICDHHVRATICTASMKIANEFCPEETKQTNIYIIGGSANSGDGPYLLSDELANSTCDVHNASTNTTDALENIGGFLDKNEKKDKKDKKDNTNDNDNPNDDNKNPDNNNNPDTPSDDNKNDDDSNNDFENPSEKGE